MNNSFNIVMIFIQFCIMYNNVKTVFKSAKLEKVLNSIGYF